MWFPLHLNGWRLRPVSLAEALGLGQALGVTVEQLIDSRGGSQRGPSLVFTDKTDKPDLPPASVTALLCPHIAYAENFWNDDEWQGVTVMTTDEPSRPMAMVGRSAR
jgi:hypothetical protein